MNFIVVAYYTLGSLYETHIQRLIESMDKLGIDYDVQGVASLGSWDKNTHYKPRFILDMLDKHKDKSVVYTDADSEFLRYPDLFATLDCDVAVYLLDHSQFERKRTPPEVLSGTIYFGNTETARKVIRRWQAICDEYPQMWDQAALQRTLVGDFTYYNLPPQYCCIKDYMRSVPDKVVLHYQASREQRKLERQVKKS